MGQSDSATSAFPSGRACTQFGMETDKGISVREKNAIPFMFHTITALREVTVTVWKQSPNPPAKLLPRRVSDRPQFHEKLEMRLQTGQSADDIVMVLSVSDGNGFSQKWPDHPPEVGNSTNCGGYLRIERVR